ncbi:MAG TPA: NAD(P)/FAD-dependent oxidoreductase [Acidimicrobiales bacterium]|nr:NAD(P)/FAD-dependent oxidoreductase [Acidimicrobiales bacterium]
MTGPVDVVVVGAGPNGLAAAIELARAGRSVTVLEAADVPGGGARTAELTRPGFRHDVCSAVHPLAAGSPFLRSVPLAAHGCELVHPELPLVHPLDGGRAGVLHRDLHATVAAAGADGSAWAALFGPLVHRWDQLEPAVLGPLLRVPRHPLTLARFGIHAVLPASWAASRFDTDEVRGVFAGIAGHSFLPLEHALSTSFALVLGALAHTRGWPVVRGGSQALADALVAHLRELGGTVVTGCRVRSLAELPPHRAVVADVTPRQLAALAGDALDGRARRRLLRFRPGPGACKVDYALAGPVPWANADARRAGTLHLGGTLEEIAAAERTVARGGHAERPYVLVSQPSIVDGTRAPEGHHVLWAYCHVPNGSTLDVSERITDQIERFAPGFRDLVLDRHVLTAADLARYNPTYVGGDISAGSHAGTQLVLRPWPALDPYRTPVEGVFLCSASTPPGGGVHGMCGHHAARSVLRWLDGRRS